jgi:hypothetical protein
MEKIMKKIILLITTTCLFLIGCGKSSDFQAKIEGQSVMTEIKSGFMRSSEYVPGDGTKTGLYQIILNNFEMSANGQFESEQGQKLTAPEQAKVIITLYGEKAKSDRTTPLKPGDYPAATDAKNTSNQTYSIGITRFVDGKENPNYAYLTSQPNNSTMVKITSVTDDTVTGEIVGKGDANKKPLEISGKFTAKIQKPK